MQTACCDRMASALAFSCPDHSDPFDCPDALLVRDPTAGVIGLIVHDGGRSSVEVRFCPWCGSVLTNADSPDHANLSSLERTFLRRGILHHGLLLLSADAGLDLVERAREEGVPILGVDAFRLEGPSVQPVSEASVDFSSSQTIPDSWSAATNLIRERSKEGFVFEVVLGAGDVEV